ncbi:MAG TPA: hypothetical protein VGI63_03930 [Verrucomicrobiae bacterium]
MRQPRPTAERRHFNRFVFAGLITGAASAVFAGDALKPHQAVSTSTPPASPENFNPDPNALRLPEPPPTDFRWSRRVVVSTNSEPPPQFNPDPGASFKTPATAPATLFNEPVAPPEFTPPTIPADQALPRENVRFGEILPPPAPTLRSYGSEPLTNGLALPRANVRRELRIIQDFSVPKYSLRKSDYPTNTVPMPDRWRIGFVPWKRYTSGVTEQPYETPNAALWTPYKQSVLKGDLPVIGQDIFLDLTASSETVTEVKRVPTASGVSTAAPGENGFYGNGEQISIQNNFAFTMNLFQGETVFRPVTWAVKLEPVFNVNYLQTQENGAVSPNPQQGTDRTKTYFALQQAFVEAHLADLSDNYDFVSVRAGNQPFNADFRGFIFNDVNSGVRLFGNWNNNLYQYNLAFFDMREKDTDSELNTFDNRNQNVYIANLYRQDFIWPGYTAEWSFLYNQDYGGTHYDENGNLVRPEPIGTVQPHDVNAYYLGWGGDGHIGPVNISHQFYQAFGRDDCNGLAGHAVNINAQMAALELSIDHDWARYKASFFYASGDGNSTDGTARGFDTIVDNPNFTGGPFSFWSRQGFNLGGTMVNLKNSSSLVPDLRTSKTEGQANFVNPGVYIFGLGAEFDLTPKLRSFLNANYIMLAQTDPVETALQTSKQSREIGEDLSLGFQYRPFLTDNIIVSAGFGVLVPGQGYRDIYGNNGASVPGFGQNSGNATEFPYSGLIAVTFTY